MKKLRLEDLTVESFHTDSAGLLRGTVRGHGTEEVTWCGEYSCDGTCDPTQHGLCATDEPGCNPDSAGLSVCCYTNGCTQNMLDPNCDSIEFCAVSYRHC